MDERLEFIARVNESDETFAELRRQFGVSRKTGYKWVDDRFRHEYNDQRPHEALGQRTPMSRYSSSRRTMPNKPSSPEYADTMAVRRIGDIGRLQFGGSQTYVSKLIAGESVGLLPVADEAWELYYGLVLLAQVTLRNKEFQLSKVR